MKNCPNELKTIAAGFQYDNHTYGDQGFCDPDHADWTLEFLNHTHKFDTIEFNNSELAKKWILGEIEMDITENLGRGWKNLLTEEIHTEVVVLIREDKIYIWDGYHRIAAAIATGRPVLAIVGRPHHQ